MMEIEQKKSVSSSELQYLMPSGPRIEGLVSLLTFAWECVDTPRSSTEIRAVLEQIQQTFPEEGAKALERFNGLAKRCEELSIEPLPEWLQLVTKMDSPEQITVELLPTAILVRMPPEVFRRNDPGAAGVTFSSAALPDELRGMIICVPDRALHELRTTLRHEIIHTLEHFQQPEYLGILNWRISEATNRAEVSRCIQHSVLLPQERAQREIVAYLGTGDSCRSLDVFGLREARRNLDETLWGLAFNPALSQEDKRALFDEASKVYQEFICFATTLYLSFKNRLERGDTERAVAEWLVQRPTSYSSDSVAQRGVALSVRLWRLLGIAEREPDSGWYDSDEWAEVLREFACCPHPTALFLIRDAIEGTRSDFVLRDLLEVARLCIQLSPRDAKQLDWRRVLQRLRTIVDTAGQSNSISTPEAQGFLDDYSNGALFLEPFSEGALHPYQKIAHALLPATSATELEDLLRNTYPHRHPIWKMTRPGEVIRKVNGLPVEEAMPLVLAVAEHCSKEYCMVEAINYLARQVRNETLPQHYAAEVQRVVNQLLQNQEFSPAHPQDRERYDAALKVLVHALCSSGAVLPDTQPGESHVTQAPPP
jgi:hypothetical protein